MKCLIVIPARMGATRFPGKPLHSIAGKAMVQWVHEAAVKSGAGERVVVATPDEEIVSACREFGAEAILTRHDHTTGTDRIAAVAERIPADFYVNVQGDEPLIDPASIVACAQPMLDPEVLMASVYDDCAEEEWENPNVVKVVTDLLGDALYFSRHAIPFSRNPRTEPVKKHVGLYAYRGAVLREFSAWPQSPNEIAESLEQLRMLHHGIKIRMAKGAATALAVDTPDQADEVERILLSRV